MTRSTNTPRVSRNLRIATGLLLVVGLYGLTLGALSALAESANGTLISLRAEHYGPLFQSTLFHGILGLAAMISCAILRPLKSIPRYLPQAFVLILPFLFLFSVDCILNVAFPPALKRDGIFRPHKTRGWAMLPNSHMYFGAHIYVDRYGFRVPEDQKFRTVPPRPRILFVGDSLTFGLAVKAEQCFAELTGDAVRKMDGLPKFNVLNAGVTGYDIAQSLDQLRELETEFQPDLIVQQICFNDISEQYDARHGRDEGKYPEYRYMARDPHWSAIVRLVFDWARKQRYGSDEQAAAETIQHVDLMRLLEEPPSATVEQAWERVFETERKLIAFCKEKSLPLIVVAFPIQQQFIFGDLSLDPQARLAAFFSKTDVPFVDISSVYFEQYERTPENGELLFVDDTHPTRLGHRIAAEATLKLLRDNNMLEKAAQRFETKTP